MQNEKFKAMEEYLAQFSQRVAGTGSRSFFPSSEPRFNEIKAKLTDYLSEMSGMYPNNVVVISGGAEGWDHHLAGVAHALEIPFVLCIPNKGYPNYYWIQHSRTGTDRGDQFFKMASYASFVEYTAEDVYGVNGIYIGGKHTNFVRNERMVELCTELVVYKPSSSGTKHCLDQIKKANKPWREFK